MGQVGRRQLFLQEQEPSKTWLPDWLASLCVCVCVAGGWGAKEADSNSLITDRLLLLWVELSGSFSFWKGKWRKVQPLQQTAPAFLYKVKFVVVYNRAAAELKTGSKILWMILFCPFESCHRFFFLQYSTWFVSHVCMCAVVPGGSLPLCGTGDVVKVLYPSRRCPPLFPAVSQNIKTNMNIASSTVGSYWIINRHEDWSSKSPFLIHARAGN